MTSALGVTNVSVARAVLLYEDDDVLGGPFFVADFVAGRVIQSRKDLDRLDSPTVTAVSQRLVETLATLHRVDPNAVGLERFDDPTPTRLDSSGDGRGNWELVATAASTPSPAR